MLKVILILLVGFSNLPKTTPCASEWNQCGGLNYAGDTMCCPPTTCKYSNPWYSQCLQGPPDSTTTTTTTTQANGGGCSGVYGQCGGQNWGGPFCCTGSTCSYGNPYYSQCLPDTSTTPSTTSSTTTPSTTQSTTTTTTPSTTTTTTTPSTTTTTTAPSTTTTTTAASTSSSTTSSNQVCVNLYQQCGGLQYYGSTTCCSGSTCIYLNDWYWQCQPSGQSTASSSSSSSSTASSTASSSSSSSSSTSSSSGNDGRQPGVTTRYWDCCKPSCSWKYKATVSSPVQTCQLDGVTIVDADTTSVCNGGGAYMCNNQQPWNVSSGIAYGYAAAHLSGQGESDWCCACYSLLFTSGPVAGQEMIVQVTNTGGDLGANHFDLQMPAGGFGIFNGCASQFSGFTKWGAQYGGISQRSQCDDLPPVLKPGCYWRFDWFKGADNPNMSFKKVACPAVLTANTNCNRL